MWKMTRRSLAPYLLAAFVLTAPVEGGERTSVADGVRYHLVSTGPKAEADDWVRMLDAAWPQYAAFFGKSPPLAAGARLNVVFSETIDEMRAEIRRAGGAPPDDAGGYYDPVSKTAFAWRQPSAWYTRTLVLHECAHQFHRLARVPGNVSPPAWYGEGVVEHLSHHTWDGEKLRLGVVPMLSLEDRPGKALDAVKGGAFHLDDVLDGKAPAERPECMHLVRWLCTAEGGKLRPKFDDLAVRMDRGAKVDASDFAKAVGPWKRRLPEFLDWLKGVQQPWEPLFVDWDARGEAALRGTAPVVGLCRRRADTRRVAVRVKPAVAGSWRGGILLRWAGPDDYDIGVIDNGRRAQVDRRRAGAWQRLAEVDVPRPSDGVWRLEAERSGESVVFSVFGEKVAEVESTSSSMGLAVDAGSVDFTEIEAR